MSVRSLDSGKVQTSTFPKNQTAVRTPIAQVKNKKNKKRRRTHGWDDKKTPPPAGNTRFRKKRQMSQQSTRATRSSTAQPFTSLKDIHAAMRGKSNGGMLMYDLISYNQDEYYRGFKGKGGNKVLRRFQVTDVRLLEDMTKDARLHACISTLSEYEFGFQVLQSICRSIFTPVKKT